jgi:hypothetical protein
MKPQNRGERYKPQKTQNRQKKILDLNPSACSAVCGIVTYFFLDFSGMIMTKYSQQYPPSLSTMLKLAGYFFVGRA